MNQIFTITRQVAFSETDMAGLAHFSNYFKWMEVTENLFLQEHQILFIETRNSKTYAWPRVNVSCTYKAPLFFQNKVAISLTINSITKHSITYFFNFDRLTADPEKVLVATGEMTAVFASTNPLSREPIPAKIRDSLEIMQK